MFIGSKAATKGKVTLLQNDMHSSRRNRCDIKEAYGQDESPSFIWYILIESARIATYVIRYEFFREITRHHLAFMSWQGGSGGVN